MIELDRVVSTAGLLLDLFKTDTGNTVAAVAWGGNEKPNAPGNGEEDRGKEEGIVVTELGDGGGGGESTSSTSDFVEDMLDEVR